jgi:DNA-binding beta-propeller fold protein YncE
MDLITNEVLQGKRQITREDVWKAVDYDRVVSSQREIAEKAYQLGRLDAQGNTTYLKKVTVGSLPDGMAFSPDGSKLIVANEGEIDGDENFVLAGDKSNDPMGTISIIAIANGVPADTALSLDFTAFDDGASRASERPAGVRIGIAGNDFSRDVEPEYVSISPDGTKAHVTLQENNAVAVVDLASNRIERIISMGYKDHGLTTNALAPSDKVGATTPFALKSYANLYGLYMPDGIASFTVNGTPYFIMVSDV